MKVAIIGPAHPLRPGGITTFNERLCRAFLQEGHSCEIWSFSYQYPSFLFPGTSQFTDAPPPADLRIHSAIHSINPVNWVRVGNRIKKSRPDLVVVRYWLPLMGPALGTLLRIIKKNKHTRIVCIADNVVPHEARPGDSLFTRYFVAPVDSFIVMSEQVLKDLKQFTTKPATLLPHPLYDNFGESVQKNTARQWLRTQKNLPVANTDRVALFFGLIRKYKGLDVLLEALKKVTVPNFKLLIAGEFYDAPELYDAWLKDPLLTDKIVPLTQFIPNEEVKYVACAADVIVQPYRHATQSGVTPMAYHFEVPMIVTNVGGLPEMVEHGKTGLICEPNSDAIASAINDFFALPDGHFQAAIQQEKKKLSWKNLVGKIVALSNSAV